MPNEPFVTAELPVAAGNGQGGNGHAPVAPVLGPPVVEEAAQTGAGQGHAATPAAAGTGARAFHERLLEAGERDRLRALLVGTTERAERYLAILSAMVAARAAYRPRLRTEELLVMLPAGVLELDFD